MTLSTLNLPTEVPWERICVTRDMIAQDEHKLPGKWRSSIAVFKYVPDEDYQLYPEREVSYLKLVVTVSGYQARDKEVEGRINWLEVTTTNIPNVDALLDHYHPCTGALVQLTVIPKEGATRIQSDNYPYLMDFQPKKREMYQTASDTNEVLSRSLESLHLRKAAGTTESLEVLDIDQGGSGSGKLFWGAVEAGGSSSGQYGTKRLSSEEESIARTTDQSRERREVQSHTTQLSQMYHLFDSYHQGTNRGVFFIQPRPHTLEEPSGFVKGPRRVEGIQEIFAVVNRPKDGPDYCVTVRLDTAHYVDVPIMGYETPDVPLSVYVDAVIPNVHEAGVKPIPDGVPGDRRYYCVSKDYEGVTDWTAPAGYVIDTSVDGGITPGPKKGTAVHAVDIATNNVTLVATATARACVKVLEGGYGGQHDEVPAPEYNVKDSSSYDVTVHLRSESANKVVGSRNVLMVTTRSLDCCRGGILDRPVEGIAAETPMMTSFQERALLKSASSSTIGQSQSQPQAEREVRRGTVSAREANELSDQIRFIMQRSTERPQGEKVLSYIETDLFADLLQARALESPANSRRLDERAIDFLPPGLTENLKSSMGREVEHVTLRQLVSYDAASFANLTGLEIGAARQVRLELLGVPLVARENAETPCVRLPEPRKRKIAVPLVIGLQLQEATRLLASAGLQIGSSEQVDSPLPAGSIVTQSPAAGDDAEPKTRIALTLASGLSVRLPEVQGLGLIEAGCRLRDAGLRSEPTVEGKAGPDCHVVTLEPPAGSLVTPRSPVTIGLAQICDSHR